MFGWGGVCVEDLRGMLMENIRHVLKHKAWRGEGGVEEGGTGAPQVGSD